jgi:RNA polymerase sigma factor (sigma-70 family)
MPRDPFANLEPLIHRVYGYVAYRIGEGPDAEDVTSEVFERALRYRDSYDPRRGEPAAWLVGIARRCIDDRRLVPTVPLEHVPDGFATTDGPEPATIGRMSLCDALAELDDRSRELLALRYAADLSARQIGELLGMRTNTVEVALHRSLDQLRRIVPDRADGSSPRRAPHEASRPNV